MTNQTDVRLVAAARVHGGVFTRNEAIDAGFSGAAIDARIRRGEWHRVRRGIYIESVRWARLSPVQRHTTNAHAVALRCAPDLVFSHSTAAILRGWPTWNVPLEQAYVTRRSGTGARVEAGVHHFVAPLPLEQVEIVGGLRVTSKERLMIDVARAYGFEEAVVICDAALRAGAARERARALAIDMASWPLARGAAGVISFADGRSESPGESRLRVFLRAEGFEGFEPQVGLYAPGSRLIGRVDFADEEHGVVLEFDGKAKYGIDGRDAREQLWQEKLREDAIRELGYDVVRVRWSDLERPVRLSGRIRAAISRAARQVRRAA